MTGLCMEVAALRSQVAAWRGEGRRIALVPTMGALHAGHLALVERGRAEADRLVVTIFVNPKQFGPTEDFGAYPRDLDKDRLAVASAGADLVYAPALPAMYPDGFATSVEIAGPAAAGLEDRFRPGHFAGVATIVAKLLIQAGADVALFGEKDFQQYRVIERLVRDLDIPVALRAIPVVREPDGLALSSRNVYLSAEERGRAPQLHAALQGCAEAIGQGGAPADACREAAIRLAEAGFVVDYVEARDAGSLGPLLGGRPGRVLGAARLGATRLIDNVAVAPPPALR